MRKVRKFLIALGAAAGVIATSLSDGQLDASEDTAIVLALVGAALVWVVPNTQAD